MQDQNSQSVQTSMLSLANKAEQRSDGPWYTCPSCQVEWNRLRVCNYIDDNKQAASESLCVKCAETLVAWDWLMFTMPLPSAFLTCMKWTGPRYRQVGPNQDDKVDNPQNAYVILEVAGMEIAARSEGSGRGIRYKYKGKDEVYTADNIYQLRSKMMHTVPY